MTSKKNLLKELGWPNELIQHFMIDDSEYTDDPSSEYPATVYDTNTFVVNSNQNLSGNMVILSGKNVAD